MADDPLVPNTPEGPRLPNGTEWARVVERIRQGEEAAVEELYAFCAKGVRYFLLRRLGRDELEDRVHDVFIVVAEAIRKGDLRDPARLIGYIRTVVRRTIAGVIQGSVNSRVNYVDFDSAMFSIADWRLDPEEMAVKNKRAEVAGRVLNGLSSRDREVLRRFYLEEQTQEQICKEMHLTDTQFRLLKTRAKARFSDMGRRVTQRMGLRPEP